MSDDNHLPFHACSLQLRSRAHRHNQGHARTYNHVAFTLSTDTCSHLRLRDELTYHPMHSHSPSLSRFSPFHHRMGCWTSTHTFNLLLSDTLTCTLTPSVSLLVYLLLCIAAGASCLRIYTLIRTSTSSSRTSTRLQTLPLGHCLLTVTAW